MPRILITGAGSGIGRATALRFAREGWELGLLDRDATALAATIELLGAAKAQTFQQTADVTDYAAVQAAITAFAHHAGHDGFNALILSHGVLTIGPFISLSAEQHRRTIEINVIGNLNCLLAAFPYLKGQADAQVIGLCSASAVYGTPDFASYSASKFAVRGLTEALEIEWAGHGIRVSDLMPPFVNTPMVTAQAFTPPVLTRLGVDLAPEDVAETIWQQAQGGPTHKPVGWKFALMKALVAITPQPLVRWAYGWLSR